MTKALTEKKLIIPKKTKHSEESHIFADKMMREADRVKRWKMVHDLLRKHNKRARREQDKIAKECAEVRNEGIFRTDKSKHMGLRFGVSLPPMTYNAVVLSDRLIHGHSELANPSKEEYSDIKGSNEIVKDLSKAFPQYKVTK